MPTPPADVLAQFHADQVLGKPPVDVQARLQTDRRNAGLDIPPNSPLADTHSLYNTYGGGYLSPQEAQTLPQGQYMLGAFPLTAPLGAYIRGESAYPATKALGKDAASALSAILAGKILGSEGAQDIFGGIKGAAKAAMPKSLSGKISDIATGFKSGMGPQAVPNLYESPIGPPAPSPTPPVQYTGTDFPFSNPTLGGSIPTSSPMPSPPLRPIGDWMRSPEELTGGAVYGNSPRPQPFLNPPSTAAKMSSDPARLAARFQPGDLSDMAAPQSPTLVKVDSGTAIIKMPNGALAAVPVKELPKWGVAVPKK